MGLEGEDVTRGKGGGGEVKRKKMGVQLGRGIGKRGEGGKSGLGWGVWGARQGEWERRPR